jgi:hypothetical protein
MRFVPMLCVLLLLLLLQPTCIQAVCNVDAIDGLTVCRTDTQLYRGHMVNAQRQGHGDYWTYGTHYRGMWLHNKQHGYGVLHHARGGGYDGTWSKDRMHGYGRQYAAYQDATMVRPVATHWCNRSVLIYKGEFVRGLRHGYGTYWSAESIHSVYRGEWRAGVPHGTATWTYESHRIRLEDGQGALVKMPHRVLLTYEGEWRHGEYHGYGTLRTSDGRYAYAGHWVNSQRHGSGTETVAGVGEYTGTFAHGQFSGSGIWTSSETAAWLATGTIYGRWDEGQLVGLERLSWAHRAIFVGFIAGTLAGMWSNIGKRLAGRSVSTPLRLPLPLVQRIGVQKVRVTPWHKSHS